MATKYDRVSFPENMHFAKEMEGETDDFNTGVYNETSTGIYSISGKNYRDRMYYKIACFRVHRSKRTLLIIGGVLIALVCIVLIVLAAKAHSSPPNSPPEQYGLFSYPSAGLVKFHPNKHATYKEYVDEIDHKIHEYSVLTQESKYNPGDESKYINCDETMTNVPEGKVCRYTSAKWEKDLQDCTNQKYYGYGDDSGRPCVLFVLKLDSKPSPFNRNDTRLPEEYPYDYRDKKYVGLSCGPETAEDKKHINMTDHTYGMPISSHPKRGFELFYYRFPQDKYVTPAVMVQFNTLNSNVEVKVKCTAWAESFNNGRPDKSEKYSQTLSFYKI